MELQLRTVANFFEKIFPLILFLIHLLYQRRSFSPPVREQGQPVEGELPTVQNVVCQNEDTKKDSVCEIPTLHTSTKL